MCGHIISLLFEMAEECQSLDEYIQAKRQVRDAKCMEAYAQVVTVLDTSFLGTFETPWTTSKQTGRELRKEFDALNAKLQKRVEMISAAIAEVERGAEPIAVPRFIGAKFRAMEKKRKSDKK